MGCHCLCTMYIICLLNCYDGEYVGYCALCSMAFVCVVWMCACLVVKLALVVVIYCGIWVEGVQVSVSSSG
jgi:hypothetical protein